MTVVDALFYIFSGMLCMFALQTILLKNSVHAALSLIGAFISTAVLWMLLKAEFLSIILVLVYVGAVMILFLFVIMMLDKRILESFRQNFYTYLPLTIVVGILLLAQLFYVLLKADNVNHLDIHKEPIVGSAGALGKLLFTQHTIAFELVGCILLVAIIIAVVLNHRKRKDHKQLNTEVQLEASKKDRMILVDSKLKS